MLPTGVKPGALTTYNGYIYTIGNDLWLYKIPIVPNPTAIPILQVAVYFKSAFITIHDSIMYISEFSGITGKIHKVDLDNPVQTTFQEFTGRPFGLQVYNGHLYVVTTVGSGLVYTELYRISLADNAREVITFDNFVISSSRGLAIVNNYMYIITVNAPSIVKIDISNFTLSGCDLSWKLLDKNLLSSLITDGTYLYFGYLVNNVIVDAIPVANTEPNTAPKTAPTQNVVTYIAQMDMAGNIITDNCFPDIATPNTLINQFTTDGNAIFIDFITNNDIYNLPISSIRPIGIACFHENTKILTDKGYRPIHELRKGDLIKTDGYKAIDMIGKRQIYHPASQERIKDQLYQYGDLILTGGHAILVDEIDKEKVAEFYGDIYITGNKYRLPACLHPEASVYEKSGEYTIYHLALENTDYYMNYGIYANGIFVESCSKRYLKELSGMTLIE